MFFLSRIIYMNKRNFLTNQLKTGKAIMHTLILGHNYYEFCCMKSVSSSDIFFAMGKRVMNPNERFFSLNNTAFTLSYSMLHFYVNGI